MKLVNWIGRLFGMLLRVSWILNTAHGTLQSSTSIYYIIAWNTSTRHGFFHASQIARQKSGQGGLIWFFLWERLDRTHPCGRSHLPLTVWSLSAHHQLRDWKPHDIVFIKMKSPCSYWSTPMHKSNILIRSMERARCEPVLERASWWLECHLWYSNHRFQPSRISWPQIVKWIACAII